MKGQNRGGIVMLGLVDRDQAISFRGEKNRIQSRPAPAKPLSEDQIVQELNTLFGWDRARAYQFFLLEIPGRIDFQTDVGGLYNQIKESTARGQPYRHQPYLRVRLGDETPPAVAVSVPASMQVSTKIAERDQFCVNLDGFVNVILPAHAAEIVSGAFVAGLIARIMVEMTTQKKGSNLLFRDYKRKLEGGGGNWVSPRPFTRGSFDMSRGPTPDYPGESIEEFLARISQDGTLQGAGMLHGWTFGQELKR
jgi:hypothetical protein